MVDLTILYLSASIMPDSWMKFQVGHLLDAAQDYPIISLTRKPLDLGENVLQTGEYCYWNIYTQMLRGAKLAKTKYVALAEDDSLYTKAHFNEHRPNEDAVAYDRSRWSLFVWDNMYCMRQRVSNCSLIASREYLIDALEEREKKYPNGHDYVGEVGRRIVERRLGVQRRNMEEFYSYGPIIQLNHPNGLDDTQQRQWKRHGQMRAYEIPHWGKATDIVKEYYGHP